MARAPRILTFNFHEPYLCLMAKTGLAMDVGHYETGFLSRRWRHDFRTPPEELTLLGEAEWREKLYSGYYDVVIAQNEMNAVDVVHAPAARLLVCHNRRTFLEATATVRSGDPKVAFAELLDSLREQFEFIFISESKREDYRIPGRVILPGIDLADWAEYRGEVEAVLRVGNTMRERDLMFDVDFQERVLRDLSNRIVGDNPLMPDSAPAPTHEALCELYREYRCLLHVSREAYEDGYNLSMLEAMATGMPVVALANPTSPITSGFDGYTSYDAEALRHWAMELLRSPSLATEIGARGRATVGEKFPIGRFAREWREAIEEAADNRPGRRIWKKIAPGARRQILLQYMASPFTTGRYFDLAARVGHDVVSVGFRLPEDILRSWGFGDPIPVYAPLDIDVPFRTGYEAIVSRLPERFVPDFLLYIDTSEKEVNEGIDRLPFPKAAYFIDTHVQLEPRLRMAEHFDVVFLAQRAHMAAFQARGKEHVHWVPLACWPQMHAVEPRPRSLDVAYVGSLNPAEDPRRHALLSELARRYPNSVVGRRWPHEMAEVYAGAKIVVNLAHNRDVNMRVFEGMASGALLITDEADGLEELFDDGVHLVIARDDEQLFSLIDHYLANESERCAIAAAGQRLVLEKHTYAHRLNQMLDLLDAAALDADRGSDLPKRRAYYECPRREILPFIPLHAQRVLDVGCGAGVFGLVLKEERGVREVRGIEIVPTAYEAARHVLDEVLLGNIEEMELPFPENYFDCIICADVLEHLVDPAQALRKLSRVLAPDGSIVISIPNIQYHEILTMLSSGAWTYMEAGLMDSTHLRFFTRTTVRRMLEQAGLEAAILQPLNVRPADYVPLEEGNVLQMGKVRVENLSEEDYENFRVYQWCAVAVKPGVDRLSRARDFHAQGQYDAALLLAEAAVGVDESARGRVRARALAKLGRLNEALEAFSASIQLKDDPETAGDLGILLIAMGRSGEAKPLLQRAVSALPGNDRYRGARGLLEFVEGNHEAGYEDMKVALENDFEHRSLLPHFVQAAIHLHRHEAAAGLVQRFAEFYPLDIDIATMLVTLLHALGRNAEAEERLQTLALFLPADDERLAVLRGILEEDPQQA